MHIHIIGAGISGLTTAFMAVQQGHPVSIYESQHAGAGASGRALGALVPSTLERPIDLLQREGITHWPALAEHLARATGHLTSQLFRSWPIGGQLNLPLLLPAMAQALKSMGVTWHTQTVTPSQAPNGPTLWATGWGVAHVIPGTTLSAGQVVRLGVPSCLQGQIPLSKQGKYFLVPEWGDQTLLVGSENQPTSTPLLIPEESISRHLQAIAAKAHPELENAPLIASWVGNRPLSAPRLPLIRPVKGQNNQWAVAGLGGVGYALAPMVAKAALAELTKSA
jgi:glycine/D-amino acid oxidase-like deaminating enzyme